MYWIIKKTRTNGCEEYLKSIRPTKFTDEKVDALHMTNEEVARHSKWLITMGVSHTLQQYSTY